MNDFSELEAELKQLRPVSPTPQLATRIERALDEPASASAPQFRGARAASLPFAAACRKHLRALYGRSTQPFGKLPNRAGWQPALPRPAKWFALGLGAAAAAAFFLLARIDVDPAARPAQKLAAVAPVPAAIKPVVSGLVPDGLTRVVYNTRDEGLVYSENATAPVRRVRSRSHETLQWRDPGTGASLRVSYPTEEVELIPISGQ